MKYAALVALVLSLGSLAGCGGGGNPMGMAGKGGGGGGGGLGGFGGNKTPACSGSAGTTAAVPAACTSNPSDYTYLFQNPCAPIEERITDLLAQMTPDEKLGLMNEYQFPITRLGV